MACAAGITIAVCGTTETSRNEDDTFNVSAHNGSANESWDRAAKEASKKASVFCDGMGQRLLLSARLFFGGK